MHSNKPFPLIVSKEDKVMKTLYILNEIIEEFLENTIINWLDSDIIVDRYYSQFDNIRYGI